MYSMSLQQCQICIFPVFFQFDIEGTTGTGNAGDIAIDDVRLLPGNCSHPGDCNFEADDCGWMNTDTDDLD